MGLELGHVAVGRFSVESTVSQSVMEAGAAVSFLIPLPGEAGKWGVLLLGSQSNKAAARTWAASCSADNSAGGKLVIRGVDECDTNQVPEKTSGMSLGRLQTPVQ